MTATGPKACPNADDVGAAPDLAGHAFERVGRGDLDPVLAREFAPVRATRSKPSGGGC